MFYWDKEAAAPVKEEWRQLLLDAADAIERHGWCQGIALTPDGEMCAVGALHVVGAQAGVIIPCFDAEMKLQRHVGGFVSVWNDTPGRTKEQVVAAMREVAVAP